MPTPQSKTPNTMEPAQTTANAPLSFKPYVELLTWGSLDNPKLYKKGKIHTKYKHYIAEQMKFEPVGHTSIRLLLPADTSIRERLKRLNGEEVSYRETMAYVQANQSDGTLSRQSIPVIEARL